MSQRYCVCFTSNNAYAQHFAVSCYSLLNSTNIDFDIFLLTNDLNEGHERKLAKMIQGISPNSVLHIVRVNVSRYTHLPKLDRLGIQAYFRLDIPNLIPNHINEALYLDSDLLVLKDISDLINNPTFPPLMAAIDGASASQKDKRSLNGNYFNSGVMKLDLTYWREKNLTDDLLKRHYSNLIHADQDMLNDFFDGHWHAIDSKYNTKGFDPKRMSFFQMKKELKDASIIHYMGPWKPWRRMFRSGVKYWVILLKTPYWKNSIGAFRACFESLKFLVS